MSTEAQVNGPVPEPLKQGRGLVAMLIIYSVLEAIDAAGEQGAPDGVIYAGLMTYGATLDQHQTVITFLTGQGYVTKSGNLLKLTDAGRKMRDKLAPLSLSSDEPITR